jgi:hypothetical protein
MVVGRQVVGSGSRVSVRPPLPLPHNVSAMTTQRRRPRGYNNQRRVHIGTNNSGVLKSLDQALNGWACRRNMRTKKKPSEGTSPAWGPSVSP